MVLGIQGGERANYTINTHLPRLGAPRHPALSWPAAPQLPSQFVLTPAPVPSFFLATTRVFSKPLLHSDFPLLFGITPSFQLPLLSCWGAGKGVGRCEEEEMGGLCLLPRVGL